MYKQPALTNQLWIWFVAGFALVFVAMLFFLPMYTPSPYGAGILKCPLWKYYVIEIKRLFGPGHDMLGSMSDGASAWAITAIEHLLCSTVGGVILLAVGWIVRKLRDEWNE